MLTVIFGAGASFDSNPSSVPKTRVNDGGSRPPLANDLFAERFGGYLTQFFQLKPLVPRLRHLSKNTSIEQVLERIQEESQDPASPDSERAKQLAAVRFYIQVVVGRCSAAWEGQTLGITNYLTLLDDILRFGNREVTLVTFNYDTLLEAAIRERVRVSPATMDDYLNLGPFALFKVHGSVNWGRVVTKHETTHVNQIEDISAALIQNAATNEVSHEYRLILGEQAPIVRDTANKSVLLPAVAIPVQTKQIFECPADHLADLVRRLSNTSHILIVGWRGIDQHFGRLLHEHLRLDTKIQIVCGAAANAEGVRETLQALGVNGKYESLEQGFSSYVLDRAGEAFLRDSGRNP